MSETINDNVRVLSFAEAKLPDFKEHRGGAYIKFGEDNLYPDYLQDLFDKATKHGAIVSGKATYISGNGWKVKDGTDPIAEGLIKKVNRHNESLADVTKKAALDIEIFAGAYLQIIWNNTGTAIAEIYHIDYTRIRSNQDNTQFHYREDWGSYSREPVKVYPAFNPANRKGSQIYFLKEYRPGCVSYPLPAYMRALNYISAEIEVGKHTYGNAQNGFTPSKSITLVNGEPSQDEKKKMTRQFERAFTGSDGKKLMLWFANQADQKPIIEDLGQSDLSKEDYTAVDNLIQNNIYTGHGITTPALFGIATAGQLGQAKEMRDGYEIFKNTYVNDKQRFLESHVNTLAKYFGVLVYLEIIPTAPIGLDITPELLKDIAPKTWFLEQAGIDPTKYPELNTTVNPETGQMEANTNDAIRNLTSKQHQQVMRILRQVDKGQLTKERATVLLSTGYGLSPEDITTLLAVDDPLMMSEDESEDDKAISVFMEYGVSPEGLTVLTSKKVKFTDDMDAEVREYQFKTMTAKKISELKASILDLISKDKRITNEILAKTLNVPEEDIEQAIKQLIETGSLSVDKTGEIRQLDKPLKEAQEGVKAETRQFVVKYSYDGPKDSRNRPFCARLMELNRFYTRTEIESISARLGYSVWDRRGGFYHNPNTDTTTAFCRHSWVSHVVMKQAK